ncbi:phosphate propanoyltransferase [Clostridium sardiniense]|uniref:Phosphate propanoyltransferase n=1 Tax=Clostridium sardiniense TaxID=29369 RepID=A0ABS7KUY3_CLOSR|nr:phosphate propanoyltransferase [Clostridium sardiniense]MBY0754595.1 phosphate propanoyltransferase [Clostridium sardiniense]MDQ0460803.1 putative phosphotransacetylase [Clostridium sardiniense]
MQTEETIKLVTKLVMDKLSDLEKYKIPIGVSNRHVHVSQADLEVLFGKGYVLTKKSDLKQPGQFAANETVTIRCQKGEFKKVRILGPIRERSQVEISLTDSFRLGIKAPIKESGHLENTPGVELIGPNGSVKIEQGTIVALRHIHMPPEYAEKIGVKDKEIVEVETLGEREGILGNVLVRISDKFSLEMHIDIDEANACALKNNDFVILRKI